ncbi:hypothetical protein DY000_02022184 [Brassica cretica]|uniref:Uncharacterized protein n=1 Tax=Brassica cretica TaxID=69181 RepID=A0ABQ7EFF5_BRACR|nr:hypothetical protein DY000_02022184 [Brassica cretica]
MKEEGLVYVGLKVYGLAIVGRVPLLSLITKENKRYLETKRTKMGHMYGLKFNGDVVEKTDNAETNESCVQTSRTSLNRIKPNREDIYFKNHIISRFFSSDMDSGGEVVNDGKITLEGQRRSTLLSILKTPFLALDSYVLLCYQQEEGYSALEKIIILTSLEESAEEESLDVTADWSEREEAVDDHTVLVQNFEDEAHYYDYHVVYSASYMQIESTGRRVLVYLRGHEGRGIGLRWSEGIWISHCGKSPSFNGDVVEKTDNAETNES